MGAGSSERAFGLPQGMADGLPSGGTGPTSAVVPLFHGPISFGADLTRFSFHGKRRSAEVEILTDEEQTPEGRQ